jgi:SAM-dependent methyltransferase
MDLNFWNERYSQESFAYGKEPNTFLVSKISCLKPQSKVLCLAEGEGRNAVFLSEHNHRVTAVDYSEIGLQKLMGYATQKGLHIDSICMDLNNYKIEEGKWDAIVCIFGHFLPDLRSKVFRQVYKGLTRGGVFLLEAYHKDQLNFRTGGPQDPGLLYDVEDLKFDLSEFDVISIERSIREIAEGQYHQGRSAVVQVVAGKM